MPFDGLEVAKERGFNFKYLKDTPADYFDVQTEDVFNKNGVKIPGYTAVIRDDTGDTLAVHTDSYRPISDRQIFESFETGLDRVGISLDDAQVHREASHQGARNFATYLIPSIKEIINGATVSLRFMVWNSHDGSRRAAIRAGFYNFWCANGIVRGQDIDSFEIRHSGSADVDVELKMQNLVSGISSAQEELARMRKWAERPVLDVTAKSMFEALPASNKTLVGTLLSNWTDVKASTGPNAGSTVWALYNVLTDWATHTEGRTKNAANARLERELRVAKLIQSREWETLAA
jgi:hypothetical protein